MGWRDGRRYLHGRQRQIKAIAIREVPSSILNSEILAQFTVAQTARNPHPILSICHTLLKPVGAIPLKLVSFAFLSSVVGGDDNGYGEAEEYNNEEEHEHKVKE